MRSRAARVTLTLLAIVGIGAAGWYGWSLQRRIASLDAQAAAFVQARLAASRQAFELQSAQQAYVAAGQNESFWFARVDAAANALEASVADMGASSPSSAARQELAALTTAIDDFRERDARVRGYASAGQKLLAADVIFSDSLDAATRIHETIERTADADMRDRSSTRQRAARDQGLAAAGAAGGAILVMLLLLPVRAAPREDAPATIGARPAMPSSPAANLDLKPAVRQPASITKPAAPTAAAPRAQAATPAVAPAPSAQAPAPPPTPALQFDSIARLCTDLARLDNASAVPSILERMAQALDASGIVLWVADADRQELVPIAAHGYPANVLSRMKRLPLSAENATTASFKTGVLQTVSADGETNGAIAAPLVSPGGCLGVMSAEVRHNGDKQPDRLAAAMIVAAQLATIIGPPSAREENAASR
jgi:hypothetical protein